MRQERQPSRPASGLGASLRAWRERLRAHDRGRRAEHAAAQRLYGDLVGQARSARFYRELGVPDTPEGRFELIGLHAALLMRRLGEEGAAGRSLAQALFDLMFADVDASLRELGVGDLGVGKQVRRLAGQFYAKLKALDQALDTAAPGLLVPILGANVWQGGPPPSAGQVEALAAYLSAAARHLAGQPASDLLRGAATFAPPAPDRQSVSPVK